MYIQNSCKCDTIYCEIESSAEVQEYAKLMVIATKIMVIKRSD